MKTAQALLTDARPMTFHPIRLHRLILVMLATLFCYPALPPALAVAGGPPGAAALGNVVPPAIRAHAPDTLFTDLAGNPFRLSDFHGQTLLVNFWASWCAPCLREMPSLDRLRTALDGEGLRVLAVSVDANAAVARHFLDDRLGLPDMPGYHDPRMALGRALGVTALPATLILDRQGRIARRHDGPADWDSDSAIAMIRQILGEEE